MFKSLKFQTFHSIIFQFLKDIHQEGLTVQEVMMYAADLKLGFNEVSSLQKSDIIEEILQVLRLEKSVNTNVSNLSGGELKRLSIAQELVNNPPVLFLDEPTTVSFVKTLIVFFLIL